MSDDLTDLDSLWRTAKQSIVATRQAKAKAAPPPPEEDNQLYRNPANWERTRGIALIHAETSTLLGNFSEYLHKRVPGCRKLVREDSPISVSATETVEGSWWLGADRKPEPPKSWYERRSAILHCHLGELGLHAPAVELVVSLEYGGIARAELAVETVFAATDETEQLLVLPAGVNILDCMTRDCKVKLRMEIGA